MLILYNENALPLNSSGNRLSFTYPDKKYGEKVRFCSYFFSMPPLEVTVSVEVARHESVIPELAPAVRQPCFWFVSVGTLTPVLLTCMFTVFVSVSANAMRPVPIAIVLTANTAAIATIATSAVFWFFIAVIL
jgi:hypothetical protein